MRIDRVVSDSPGTGNFRRIAPAHYAIESHRAGDAFFIVGIDYAVARDKESARCRRGIADSEIAVPRPQREKINPVAMTHAIACTDGAACKVETAPPDIKRMVAGRILIAEPEVFSF